MRARARRTLRSVPNQSWCPSRVPGGQGLGDEETAGAVTSGDAGRLVEQRPGVENLQHIRVWKADHTAIFGGKASEELGELSGAWGVDACQQPPMPRRR